MANLSFDIEGNSEAFIRKIEQMRNSISAVTFEMKNAGEAGNNWMNMLGKTFNALGGWDTLRGFASDVIRVRTEVQHLENSFTTLLQSKENADALVAQMIAIAAQSPFDLNTLAAGAKQLIGYGVASEEVNDTLLRLGNIAYGVGVPLEQMSELYGSVLKQGYLYRDDLDHFAASGIPLIETLASVLGVTTSKIEEMASAGQIGFPDIQKALENMTNGGGRFYGVLDEESKTIGGKIDGVASSWDSMLNKIGQSQEGVINNSLDGVSYLIDNYEQLGKTVLELASVYGTYKAILISMTALQRLHTSVLEQSKLEMILATKTGQILSESQALSAARTKLFTGAIKENTMALLKNPYVLVAAFIAGLGYSIYKVATAETELEKAHGRLDTANANVEKSLSSEISKLSSLEKKLAEAKQGTEEFNNIKKTIVDNYGQYYQGLDEEIDRVGNLSTVYAQLVENMRLSIGQRKFESFFNAEQDSLDQTIGGKLDKAYQTLIDKYGKDKGINLYNQFFDSAMHGTILPPGAMKDLENATFWDVKWGDNAKTGIIDFRNNILDLRSEIYKETKATETILDEYKTKFRITDEEVTKILYGQEEKNEDSKILGTGKKLKDIVADIQNSEKDIRSLRKSSQNGKGDDTRLQNRILELNKLKEAYKLKTGEDYDQKYHRDLPPDDSIETINRIREQQGKYEIDFLKDIESRKAQAVVDAMDEGVEKKLAQMKLNHQNEIAELAKLRVDFLQKRRDSEKAIFEANSDNTGKIFDASKVNLTHEEEAMFANMLKLTVEQQGKDISNYYKDLLSKYQGYSEKRLSIQNKFQKEKDALIKAGASKETLAEHDYQRDNALEAVDSEFAMREDSFKAWADGIANLSLEELQKLLVQAEQELQRSEFLSPNDPKLAVQRTQVTSLKEKVNEKNQKNDISPKERSIEEWQDLYQTLGKVEKGFEDIGATVGGTAGDIISAAGGIASATLQMVDGIITLANSSSTAMVGTSQAASNSIQAVEKASVILAIIGAALQVVTKLFDFFAGDDTTEKYEKTKEAYESYIGILDQVIEKQLEMAESLSGANAQVAYDKAIELVEKQSAAAKVLGKQYLDSGASGKKHSKGYDEVDDMSSEGWSQAAQSSGMSEKEFKKKMGKRMTGLFDLTEDQLVKLRENAPIFWAQLDADTQKYANQIVDGASKVAEVLEQEMTDITQIDLGSLRNDFQGLLTDMDSSSADFADNFEEYMRNAIINSMIKESYMGRLTEWRKKLSKAMEGGMTEQEYQDLKDEGAQISEDMRADRERTADMLGWTGSGSSSQESSQEGFAAMSQETGDELNGRFTALQISNEEIKNSMLFVLGSLSSLCTTASDGNILLMEMRNLAIMSNGHLENIAKYTKTMMGFGEKLDNIDRNTQRI